MQVVGGIRLWMPSTLFVWESDSDFVSFVEVGLRGESRLPEIEPRISAQSEPTNTHLKNFRVCIRVAWTCPLDGRSLWPPLAAYANRLRTVQGFEERSRWIPETPTHAPLGQCILALKTKIRALRDSIGWSLGSLWTMGHIATDVQPSTLRLPPNS